MFMCYCSHAPCVKRQTCLILASKLFYFEGTLKVFWGPIWDKIVRETKFDLGHNGLWHFFLFEAPSAAP